MTQVFPASNMNLRAITIAKKHINLFSTTDLKADGRRIDHSLMFLAE